jgi:hypothetical protein
MLSFSCPQCGNTLQVPETHPGTLVVCPRCQRQVTAPTTALQSAPSPPARAGFASAPPPPAAPRSSSNLVPILLIGGGVTALVLFLLCAGLLVGGFLYARVRAKPPAIAMAVEPEEMRLVEGPEPIEVRNERVPRIEPIDFINRVHVQFNEGQRFGLVCPRLRDPRNPEVPKKLTRDDRGATNNTAVRIDGFEYIFGAEIPGTRYVREKGKLMKEVPIPGKDKDRAWQTAWESEFGRTRITQSVELVVGEQTRVYDTVLVKYHIWNRDRTPHQVALRIMLDTFIGGTDGVPFYVPPTATKPARFVDKMEVFAQADIPDFIQALESSNLNDSEAALALVGLKIKGVEPLEKLVICRWPQNSEARWGGGNGPGEWAYEPMDKNPNIKDSCVVLYWTQANMRPDEHRDLAFTYGLGRVPSDIARDADVKVAAGGKMRLFVPQASWKKPFVATAYVKASNANQTVTLKLPAGLQFAAGQSAQQPVPPANSAGYSQVTWKLNATRSGTFVIEAEGPGLGVATERVTVGEASLFDG